jgi:diguanylate cyclase (GGDEF)-like protein
MSIAAMMSRHLNVASLTRLPPWMPTLIVGVVGLSVTLGVWHLMTTAETRAREMEFFGRANNQRTLLHNGITDYWDKLYAIRAFFEASDDVTREDFETFSKALLEGFPAILNVGWLPRIRHEHRAAHELEGARDGLPDYHIRAILPDGSLPVAPDRSEYFPKFYSTEPRTSRVYGLDNMDGAGRERTLNRIRDENGLFASPPIRLHIGQGDRAGFWAGVPVYTRRLPHDTVEDRRRNLRGVIQGVFQVSDMVDRILSGISTPVRLYIFGPGARPDDPPIYSHPRSNSGPVEAKSQAELGKQLHRSFDLDIGGSRWTLIYTPDPPRSAGFTFSWRGHSTIVLMSGLLLSALLATFVSAMRYAAHRLEAANDMIHSQNMRFDAALNNMTQGLLMYDDRGRLSITNKRIADLFGMPWEKWKALAIGTTPQESLQVAFGLTNVGMKNPSQVLGELQAILESKKPGRIVFERNNGRTYSSLCSPMADGGFVVTFNDFTERRRAEEKISHMAHHDTLTDLANRAYFQNKLDALLAGTRGQIRFAVFSMDLDRFKVVNDTLGHLVGDKLLQAVAARMRACARDSDIIARLGGDEFAMLQIPSGRTADARSLAKRLIDAVNAPYHIEGHEISVGVSIGIAVAPGDGTNSEDLLRKADKALYRSKKTGSCYHFASDEFTRKKLQLSPPTSGRHRVTA